jgi:hypothetical protein
MYYYSTPDYSVALNAKVGSSTMARLIIKQFYPKEHQKINYARFPNGITENQKQWHWMCPGSTTPDKPIVLLVRNPLDRFLTACQQINIKPEDIDKAIDSLFYDSPFLRTREDVEASNQLANLEKINTKKLETRQNRIDQGLPVRDFKRFGYLRDDVHFFHQHNYIQRETYVFHFPDNLSDCLKFIGINENESLVANKAKRTKPILSEEQKSKIEKYYEKDIILFNSINQPSQLILPQGELSCH